METGYDSNRPKRDIPGVAGYVLKAAETVVSTLRPALEWAAKYAA